MIKSKINKERNNLLIIPCSKIKKPQSDICALDLYDGPFYRLIRKYHPKSFEILILSAKYGIIKSDEIISYYDQKMTKERANELNDTIHFFLSRYLVENQFENVYINLGKLYFAALEPSMKLFYNMDVHQASGGIGLRLHQLKKWISQQ